MRIQECWIARPDPGILRKNVGLQDLTPAFWAIVMTIKFSEDLVPLTDLKVNPGRVVRHATEAHRPVLLTSRGRGVAVVQSVGDYEKAEEERAFMRAVVAGLADLEGGREFSLDDARARLGLK